VGCVRRTRPILGAALLVLAGVPKSQAFDLAEIRARGSIRVIAARDAQPEEFSFTPGPNPGFEREMIEGFARVEHLKLEVLPGVGWDARIPLLLRREGDVIVGLTETESRRALIAFTSETIPTRHVVVTHQPHAVINTLEELRKERVGVVVATSWAQAAADAGVPAAKTQSFDEIEPILTALKSGGIGATVMSVSDFTLAAKRHPGLQMGVLVGQPEHQAWGVRKEDTELAKAMSGYIENLRRTPSWSRLVIKYFGEQALNVLGRGHGK
jgi:polar amino acid transport system substrate-binding protein